MPCLQDIFNSIMAKWGLFFPFCNFFEEISLKLYINLGILSVTATRKTKFDEWKVGQKEKETWPDLEYPFTHSSHCCLLINDDSHSYQ